ncbi:MAG: bifunctional aspartate kinase/homoserine dehydrogenase I [Bacteroidetes bacterium]|nr:bifunctional aspartate kinase/homoserine dehydrogenase I [Bacteroidota bacterium]
MQVLKFGGTSVANSANILKVIDIVTKALIKDRTIVVVSALGGTTDLLIDAGNQAAKQDESYLDKLKIFENRHLQVVRELLPVGDQSPVLSLVKKKCNELESIYKAIFLLKELSARSLDGIVSNGELLSSLIISAALESRKTLNVWIDSREVIRTNSNHGIAAPDMALTSESILSFIMDHPADLYIAPGFIASDPEGVTTTLGRGGSDFTASIFAAATNSGLLEIWTDVSGMMTADPRVVSNAKVIPYISYKEAMELSHFGAKVIYPPTIQPLMSKNIPVWIKNTFAPGDYGTLIESNVVEDKNIVRGISSMGKMAFLSLEGSGMVGIPGFSRRLFGALAEKKINVILITQSSSEHSICVAIDDINVKAAKKSIDEEFAIEIETSKVEPLHVETGLSIVALVGDNMKNHPGISGKMFGALGRNSVNIRAIAQGSSEKNISAVISTADVAKAINVLHEEFFETAYKQVNLFIVGLGNVGSRFMEQLRLQQAFLLENMRLQLRIVGIANSRRMLLNENGIDLNFWQEQLLSSENMKLTEFVNFINQKSLRNPIFVDITSNQQVTEIYEKLLRKSVAIVACNKIASSSSYENYKKLKQLAREYNTAYLFETNVGASLPIINTLNDLVRSGDKVHRIEAVLSGTLNFVFNNYNGSVPFAKIVRQAEDEGYAEPDPRIDLCGTDVMRKILILARESGYKMEMEDIESRSFLPESCLAGSVADFYREMETHEAHFKSLFDNAAKNDCKLKFVASLKDGKASVGLQHIGKDHDLYQLYGKDNVVLFYTNRYSQQPLVIKGAGAGADVTASGIFADVIRAARV